MPQLVLSQDTSLVDHRGNNSFGIREETKAETASKVQAARERVNANIAAQAYGFITTLDNPTIIQEVRTVLRSIEWADTLVVIGIGGSDLGARALQQALTNDSASFRVLFHGDSTDPVATTRLLSEINLSQTVFNIISKSGETVETIAQYIFLKEHLQSHLEAPDEWRTHFIFTTDAHKGILRQEAETHTITTLAIPDTVGGRFSVQTSVGLLPAAALGVDLEAFLSGGREFVTNQNGKNLSLTLATAHYQLFCQGTKIAVCMPYSVQLEETARWFRQLWAESLGKDGTGILPIQARGPADQHSQVQFYAQGSPIQSFLFIRIENRPDEIVLPQTDVRGVEYLSGHSLHEIINIEQRSTALALAKAGRPSITLSLSHIDAYALGQLFLFFQLAVVYLAEMLEINAFDQPGVEEGKDIMYALLNRDGYAEKRRELEEIHDLTM